jgi:hypothetical protein
VARAHHNHGARERKKAEPMHPGIITRSLAHGIKTGIYETSSSIHPSRQHQNDSSFACEASIRRELYVRLAH